MAFKLKQTGDAIQELLDSVDATPPHELKKEIQLLKYADDAIKSVLSDHYGDLGHCADLGTFSTSAAGEAAAAQHSMPTMMRYRVEGSSVNGMGFVESYYCTDQLTQQILHWNTRTYVRLINKGVPTAWTEQILVSRAQWDALVARVEALENAAG